MNWKEIKYILSKKQKDLSQEEKEKGRKLFAAIISFILIYVLFIYFYLIGPDFTYLGIINIVALFSLIVTCWFILFKKTWFNVLRIFF